MACQRPERAVGTPRSFKALAIALFNVMPSRSSAAIVLAMDRAKAKACASSRNTSPASFHRWWLAAPHNQPARRHGHQRRRRLLPATLGTLTGSRCFAIARSGG